MGSLIDKKSNAVFNAQNVIYICRPCNRWEIGTDVTLYEPDDPESFSRKMCLGKHLAEWEYAPCMIGWELKANFQF